MDVMIATVKNMIKFLKFNLMEYLKLGIFILTGILYGNDLPAQCLRKQHLAAIKQDSSTVNILETGKNLEVITDRHNFRGKLTCVEDDRIKIDKTWIHIEQVQLIIDPNESFKVNDAVALPLKYAGIVVSAIGATLATSSIAGLTHDEEGAFTQLAGGLALLGLGSGLGFSARRIASKKILGDDIFYSGKEYHFIPVDVNQTVHLKKSILYP